MPLNAVLCRYLARGGAIRADQTGEVDGREFPGHSAIREAARGPVGLVEKRLRRT